MYTEITSIEEAIKRYKEPFDLQKTKDALSFLPPAISRGMIALATLQIVVWAVNNDKQDEPEFNPDYNDSDQEKWAPWYVGGDRSASGFRFVVSSYGWTGTGADGGARLALKDEDRANHMNKYFQEQYKELLLILD